MPFSRFRTFLRGLAWLVTFLGGTWICTDQRPELAVLNAIGWVLALGVLIPATRCATCVYKGRNCPGGIGPIANWLLPKRFIASTPLSAFRYYWLFYILTGLPTLVALYKLLRGRGADEAMVFLGWLLWTLFLERWIERLICCRACAAAPTCPKLHPEPLP